MIQMRRSWSAALAVTAALMTSVPALADSTATVATPDAANASVANTGTPAYKKIMDRMSVTFAGTYYGNSAGQIANPYMPNEYGVTSRKASNTMFFDNVLPMLYKINDSGLVAGASFNTMYSPVIGRGVTIKDPYVKIGHKKLITNGGFSFGADLREYIPISTDAHNKNRQSMLRSVQYTNYDVPNSKWSFNCISSAYRFIYGENGGSDDPKWYGVINPNVNYQVLSKLGIWGGYEMDFFHANGDAGPFRWNNDGTYLYLGLSWDVTSKFNFSPYLSVRPGGAVNADSTQLTANFSYVIL